MHSQFNTVFIQTEVFDDLMNIDTPTFDEMNIDTPTTKSSILSKRSQNKRVRWEESVVDNEYKHTIKKDTYFSELSKKKVQLEAAISEQEALIQRQVGEVARLKGLWEQAQQIGAIPEGFERELPLPLFPQTRIPADLTQNLEYATAFGTAQEANTAIQQKLWDLLRELAPKREKSDKILAQMRKGHQKTERKLKIITKSVASRFQTQLSIDSHMIEHTPFEDYCDIM